jgi:hypothetical protein
MFTDLFIVISELFMSKEGLKLLLINTTVIGLQIMQESSYARPRH